MVPGVQKVGVDLGRLAERYMFKSGVLSLGPFFEVRMKVFFSVGASKFAGEI